MDTLSNRIRVGVLGASGYTGAELTRLLLGHPQVEIAAMTADRHAGKPMEEVFPHLGGYGLPDLVTVDDVDWGGLDVAFACLPHATTQEVVSRLPESLKVVDLSADFRLRDPEVYEATYGKPHGAVELQKQAVYGLTEIYRDDIRPARLVACPGCYPTAAQLPLVPLIEGGMVDADDIIIDAKSGVTGAGRSLKEGMLFAEVWGGFHAYGVATHRHGPEIEQTLGEAAGRPVTVNFTPHLVPMNRGILATIYVRLEDGATAHDLRAKLAERYADEPFVHVLKEGAAPATRQVTGSNRCLIGVFADRVKGRAIVLSAIDNLVKGASGTAVQNMNLVCGIPETTGLEAAPMFP